MTVSQRIGRKYKRLSKRYKAVGCDPGALIKAAQGYQRSSLKKKGTFGETDLEKKTMKVNKHVSKKQSIHGGKAKPGGVLDTIVHESMHAAHPKATEKEVYKKTPKLIKKLKPRQKDKFYALFKKTR